jgi:hypothetical protein
VKGGIGEEGGEEIMIPCEGKVDELRVVGTTSRWSRITRELLLY